MTPCSAGAVAEVEGKVVSAARLYRAVGLRGGFDNVSKRDWWRSIGGRFLHVLMSMTAYAVHHHICQTMTCLAGQEFGTSAAADGVWRSKYELLLKGYEDK